MITEFFGLPGSGKTYLARKHAYETGGNLVEVNGRFAMYLWAFVYACLRPKIFFVFLKEVVKENQHDKKLLWHKVRVLHVHTMAKEGRALFVRGDVIFDEGLAQALLSMYEREITARDFARFSCFLKDRKIYLVYAEAAMREARMRARGRLPRAFLGERYLQRWFPTLEKNHIVIVGLVKIHCFHTEINND